MAIIAKSSGTSAPPISEGIHLAVCARVIDLGTQHSEKFGNSSHKIMLTWETPDDTIMVDEKEMPKMISKEYTLSLNEKATLRVHLENWRGQAFSDTDLDGFDMQNIVGKACQIQIIHNENGRARISAIVALPKGVPAPHLVTDPIYFDLTDSNCLTGMNKLPDWVCEKVKASPEYKSLCSGQSSVFAPIPDDGEELPF